MNFENRPENSGNDQGFKHKKKPYYMKKRNNHHKPAEDGSAPAVQNENAQKPADKAPEANQASGERRNGGNNHQGRNHNRNHNRNHQRNGQRQENTAPVAEEAKENAPVMVEETAPEAEVTVVEADDSMVPEVIVSIEDEAEDVPTVAVTGVRFKPGGKVYYFDKGELTPKSGSFVIVDTARGAEFGEVAFGNRQVKESALVLPLRKVVRIASEEDIAHNKENKKKEDEAFKICNEKIAKHGLDMKLIEAQYSFDNSKLLFYFTSANRVDFRELVKDLASVFKTRIELRQIGIRDEAKIMGGLGVCGRPLCCSTFLSDFVQVSIKMAKEQNLSLNSGKISGCCGRLMCCLQYEYKTYAEESAKTPPVESTVNTKEGVGVVTESNPLAGTVKVKLKDKPDTPPVLFKREEVTIISRPAAKADED